MNSDFTFLNVSFLPIVRKSWNPSPGIFDKNSTVVNKLIVNEAPFIEAVASVAGVVIGNPLV